MDTIKAILTWLYHLLAGTPVSYAPETYEREYQNRWTSDKQSISPSIVDVMFFENLHSIHIEVLIELILQYWQQTPCQLDWEDVNIDNVHIYLERLSSAVYNNNMHYTEISNVYQLVVKEHMQHGRRICVSEVKRTMLELYPNEIIS